MSYRAGAAEPRSQKEKREQRRALIRLQQREKPIRLSPGCSGIHWDEPVGRHTITENILVIVHFKLFRAFSVHDTSSPAGKLWLATLEYISSIEGCTIRHWGTETIQDQESVCLIVQSENARQWGVFQQSLGIYLMNEVLIGRPMNRCLRLCLPIREEPPHRLKLLKFRFDKAVFTAVNKKILEAWKGWENRWRQEGIEVFGDWLEDNAAPYVVEHADLISAAVENQNKVFLAQVWIIRDEQTKLTENGARALEAEFKEEMMNGGARDFTIHEFVMSDSKQTKSEAQINESLFNNQPGSTINCLASLLRLPPPRLHRETPINEGLYAVSFTRDSKHIESVYDAALGKRQFPGPRGTFRKMGTFHENALIYNESDKLPAPRKPRGTEFLRLKFKPEKLVASESISESLVELKESIKRDAGYRAALYWGRSVHESDELILMIDWNKRRNHSQEDSESVDISLEYQIVQTLLQDFVTKTDAIRKEPGVFNVGFPYQSNSLRQGFPIMEVTTFEVSNNSQTQQILQKLWDEYKSSIMGIERDWVSLLRDDPPDPASLSLTSPAVVKQAGRNLYHFFHNYSQSATDLDAETGEAQTSTRSYFTTVTMWRSMSAMHEWYTDFANQCEEYERLGHNIDQIGMFCESFEGIDSKVFDMVGDCYEILNPPMPRYWVSDQGEFAFTAAFKR